MKHRLFFVATILLLGLGLLGLSHNPNSAQEFTVNGLKVILKQNPANEVISAQLYLRGGVFNLDESIQGIEPLISRSALKGSKKYPKEKLNAILDRTAAQITGSTSRDFAVISLRCIRRNFEETWDVFADVVMNPILDPEEVELERENLLVSIRQRKDNPDVYLREIMDGLFYAGHPYRLNPNGVEASVSTISVERMKSYLKDNLKTSKLLLVVVGNVEKDDLKKKVESTFGRLPRGAYKSKYPRMTVHESASVKVVERELPTNYIIGCVSVPGLNHEDYYALTMALDILRWRVWEEVRTKRGFSYAPSAFYSNRFSNQAGIYVTAVQPDTTIKVMMAEIRKMQTDPVPVKDLDDRISMYLTRYFLANESNAAQGRFLAGFELSGVGWRESEKYVENLRKVTIEDVQRPGAVYFDVEDSVIGVGADA